MKMRKAGGKTGILPELLFSGGVVYLGCMYTLPLLIQLHRSCYAVAFMVM